MALTVDAAHLGTPESAWLADPRLAARAMDWGTPARVVVLAPHPDDEVLAVGGAMRQLAARGARISIIAVTDGEGSHPRSPTTTRAQLARWRADERTAALAALGVAAQVTRLGCPDGAVASERDLTQMLIPLLAGADWCLAPWQHDGHPDHDAAGRAAQHACEATGVRLAQYPVWAWHWANPDRAELPWSRVRRVALAPGELAAKRLAIAAYRSQIAPLSAAPGDEAVLPAAVVARFHRPFELVFA